MVVGPFRTQLVRLGCGASSSPRQTVSPLAIQHTQTRMQPDRAPGRAGGSTIAAAATAAAVSAATSSTPQLVSTVWQVGGLPTEVLELPASGGQGGWHGERLTFLPPLQCCPASPPAHILPAPPHLARSNTPLRRPAARSAAHHSRQPWRRSLLPALLAQPAPASGRAGGRGLHLQPGHGTEATLGRLA